jgi:hypothetical protein
MTVGARQLGSEVARRLRLSSAPLWRGSARPVAARAVQAAAAALEAEPAAASGSGEQPATERR